MIYIYALCDSPRPVPAGLCGLEEQPLEVVDAETVAAVCSHHSVDRITATPANAWRHEAVVEALMADRAVLPVRFGTTFADPHRLRAVLVRHGCDLVAGLERVGGLVEVGVRVLIRPSAGGKAEVAPESATGTAYLRARLREERLRQQWTAQAERWAEEFHAQLAAGAHGSTRRILATPEWLLTGAYLVRPDELDAFRRRAEGLGRAHPEVRLLCTGPWPAYHFVPHLPLEEANHA